MHKWTNPHNFFTLIYNKCGLVHLCIMNKNSKIDLCTTGLTYMTCFSHHSRIPYGKKTTQVFWRGESDLITYSVQSGSLICEMICFHIFFLQNCPFGGHFVFYQSEIPTWPKLLHYLSEKKFVVSPVFEL